MQAFKFSAIDYLSKPLNEDELMTAVNKLENRFSKKEKSDKLETLFYNLKTIKGASKKICVPVQTGFIFLNIQEIICCESNNNYTTIFTSDYQKHLVSKTLKDFEELLSD